MSDTERLVSVIIPSYGRARILKFTLPSYLQPEVGEIIVVDDASPDNTGHVIAELAAHDSRFKYLRSSKNLKQQHAKNMGIKAARFPFIYFGDDDSILASGSIGFLLDTLKTNNADIVGARAVYMAESINAGQKIRRNLEFDWNTIHAGFDCMLEKPVPAPFVQAAFLIRTGMARSMYFDESYTGNCYREETDFILRAREQGCNVWFDSRAVQTNLPRSQSMGGAHGSDMGFIRGRLYYYNSSRKNNMRFLTRHYEWLRKRYPVPSTISRAQAAFECSIIAAAAKNLLSRIKL